MRRSAPRTRPARPPAIRSVHTRVAATLSPAVPSVTASAYTVVTSWYTPMPCAPMRAAMYTRNTIPAARSTRLVAVMMAAFFK